MLTEPAEEPRCEQCDGEWVLKRREIVARLRTIAESVGSAERVS